MATLVICSDFYHEELENLKKKYPKTTFLESSCNQLKESQPVIFRVPDGRFYHHVTSDRLIDVVSGHADDLLIQTGRLFSVEMKRYVSEPKFRSFVKQFKNDLDDLIDYNQESIMKLLKEFSFKNDTDILDIVNPIKVALIQTTKGPELPVLMEVMGKKEVIVRIKKYLRNYKYRI